MRTKQEIDVSSAHVKKQIAATMTGALQQQHIRAAESIRLRQHIARILGLPETFKPNEILSAAIEALEPNICHCNATQIMTNPEGLCLTCGKSIDGDKKHVPV